MRLEKGAEVDGIRLKHYKEAYKILVVHYAVDTPRVAGNNQRLRELGMPHECIALDGLVDELRSHLNLVLHGHLHVPKIYVHRGVPVVSATTTTQKNGNQGFFVLTFSEAGDVRVAHHKWLQTGFLPDPNPELNQLIGYYHVRRPQSKPAN